jgi:hypothetical protein
MITNYLDPTNFKVTVERLPNVEFFTRRAIIPSVTMTPVERLTPMKRLYEIPDRLDYAELDLSFIIDEQMNNYIEVLTWMESLGRTQEYGQFANLAKSDDGVVSDITIILENSSKNPNIKFNFRDCFPTILSPVSVDVTQQDIVYPEATLTLRHNGFTVEKI